MSQESQEQSLDKRMYTVFNSLLSAYADAVVEESMKDKDLEEQMTEAEAIVQDAKLPEPTTEVGKAVRQKALEEAKKISEGDTKALKGEDAWADKYRDDTTALAAEKIIALIASKGSGLIFRHTATAEEKKAYNDLYDQTSFETLQIINECKVPFQDILFTFDFLTGIAANLKALAEDQLKSHTMEIMSRVIGAKNPNTGLLEKNYATYGEFLDALARVQEATKDEKYGAGTTEIETK